MPSRVTDYGCGAFLAIWLGQQEAPEQLWVALCTGEPGTGVDGTILADVEPSGAAGYARQSIATGAAWSDPAGDNYATNLVPVSFGIPEADWGLVDHYALCTAASAGQVYCYGEFDVPAVITATFTAAIPAGALRLQAASLDATIVTG